MENNYSKSRIITSLIWKLLERTGVQGIQFVVSLILARILLPEEYGLIAIVMVFISLGQVFIQSGFSTALIQKKNVDDLDYSSVFYFSFLIAIVMYIILIIISPQIASYYNNQQLVNVLIVLGIVLFPGVIISIQNAYIAKKMLFKQMFIGSLISITISGAAGVYAAISGYGIWALVLQQIINQFVTMIILFILIPWRPSNKFSLSRIKILFNFGSRLLIASLLNTFYLNIRTLLIGRVYNHDTLGYYSKGEQLPNMIVTNIDSSIQSVMLPAYSNNQDNINTIKSMMRRSIITSSYIIFPIMFGLAVVSEPMIHILLTDKWLPSVPYIRVFCISYALNPIHTANLQAINALGKSNVFLKLEIIKKIIGFTIILVTINLSAYWVAIGMLISNIIFTFVNSYPNKKLLNYSYLEQLKDLFPNLMLSLMMVSVVLFVGNFITDVLMKITTQVITGVVIYIVASLVIKIDSFYYLVNSMKVLFKFKK